MVAMNLPGSQVAAVARQVSPSGGSGPSGYPDYGVAYRFRVTVDGLDLGNWASCDGLGLSFNPEEFRPGGCYDQKQFYPGKVNWDDVKLERAIDEKSHNEINQLLRNIIQDWIDWDGTKAQPTYHGHHVVITLYGTSGKNAVAEWTLHNAVVKSWSGPSLDATKNLVATEKLTFVHEGFWPTEPRPPMITIANKETPSQSVTFDYFPDRLSLVQGVHVKDSGVTQIQTEQQVTKIDERAFTLSKLRVSGKDEIVARTNTLFDWVTPRPARPGAMIGAHRPSPAPPPSGWTIAAPTSSLVKSKPAATEPPPTPTPAAESAGASKNAGAAAPTCPTLQITLGQAVGNLDVNLKKVTVEFIRFNARGEPICADFTLEFAQKNRSLRTMNPNSGGRWAHRTHLVSAGDNLQGIAQSTYRNPNAWRLIAEENAIDDPLRIGNGNVLLLPRTTD